MVDSKGWKSRRKGDKAEAGHPGPAAGQNRLLSWDHHTRPTYTELPGLQGHDRAHRAAKEEQALSLRLGHSQPTGLRTGPFPQNLRANSS